MKTCIKYFAAAVLLATISSAFADLRYVDLNSTNAAQPYVSWATAATNIQDAVDAAVAGDEIVVTNGIYATGGRDGNRVMVYQPLTLRSVNGPQFTAIRGFLATRRGDASIRCVYMATGSGLSGFTLTSGASDSSGGGLFCESTNGVVVSNCVITGNSAYLYGGGVYAGTLYNCTIIGNSGGGASYCRLINCTLTTNSASSGGGAYYCELSGCTLNGNSAYSGGGAYKSVLNGCTILVSSYDGVSECTLTNCALTGNSGYGARSSTLNRCTLSGNSYGASGSMLNNCALTGNGIGASSSTLTNCTLTGNGAGASSSRLNNCIAFFNTGANYDSSCTLNYCCTTPQPANGVGTISSDPQLASAWRLSAASPCRAAGSTNYVSGADIDGEAWLDPPPIGCDEYYAAALTGPLSVGITASFTNVSVSYAVLFTALIQGRVASSTWDFGDGIMVTNQPYTSHAWAAPGDYAVVLRAYNETQTGGISATVTVHVVAQPIHCVAIDSGNPVTPYTSWATAADNIQDAVDAATVAGALVLVTNGSYATGGRSVDGYTTNRVVIAKPVAVRSVNGPQFTSIDGSQLVRCVYMTNTASLSGFTLANSGYYGAFGGSLNNCALNGNGYGAFSSTLNNCALTGNGTGAYACALNNCTLTGNGSGAYACALNNCTVTGSTYSGAQYSALNNCIAYFNGGANYDSSSILNYCCTTPQPANGVGNISVDPQLASAWRLSAGSPCRAAGSTNYASGTDIDGEARLSPPSIGCDEYYAGALTGSLSVGITASFTNVAPGFTLQFTALIQGRAASSTWDFGDGITVANEPYTSHAWAALGDYAVVLRAYNERWPDGISATVTVHVVPGIHYVSASSTNAVAPYTSWATAATSIQVAINAATEPGAQVLVTNGNYYAIQVPRLLSVRSVNGPDSTIIHGGSYGPGVRCAYLASGASLSGFALSGGFTEKGGGVFCESRTAVVSNCVLSGNKAGGRYYFYDPAVGEYHYDYYENGYGGGAYGGTLNNCTLVNNSVTGQYIYDNVGTHPTVGEGGGAYDCTLNNCLLSGNSAASDSLWVWDVFPYSGHYEGAPGWGGGAYQCTLNNCTLTTNSASSGGGGASDSTLNNCTLARNDSGAYSSTLKNCALTGNGIGASGSTLSNCTLTGNGAGASSSMLNNCIAYFNTGANYDSSSTLNYSCTTPLPTNGFGNITSDPQLASAFRLSFLSPCLGKGSPDAASGVDIDGEPWANPPSMGCDEIHAGATTGPLTAGITASLTTVTVGYPVAFTGLIAGRTDLSLWSFGDGAVEINQPYATHSWSALGDYVVSLWAYNDSYPDGVSATVTVHVVPGIHYVAANNTNPVAPYTSWATAATNIQDAVDAAVEPRAQVLVTNGIYATGARVVFDTNRVVVDKGLTVRSVNGPLFTTIDGSQSARCVYFTRGGLLSGFTLTNGLAGDGGGALGGTLTNCTLTGNSSDYYGGGGAYGCTLNNCTLTGNSASGSCLGCPGYGGGAYECTLNNCVLTGNSARFGGGAIFSTLSNCTLTGNSAAQAGGAWNCTLRNCIVYFNTSTNGPIYDPYSTLSYCCTDLQPTNGVGNISNAPLFVDQASGNLRLQSNSPCINAGNNSYVMNETDLDGNPRIVGGAVDIGAYEFQTPVSRISYAWLQQFNLPADFLTDGADPDGDGVDNYHEWLAGTYPTNRFSSPAQLTIIPSSANVILTWSTNAIGFTLQSATNLDSLVVWSTNSPAPIAISGQNIVTNPVSGTRQFYRLSQ